jgi:hypothetical protein
MTKNARHVQVTATAEWDNYSSYLKTETEMSSGTQPRGRTAAVALCTVAQYWYRLMFHVTFLCCLWQPYFQFAISSAYGKAVPMLNERPNNAHLRKVDVELHVCLTVVSEKKSYQIHALAN